MLGAAEQKMRTDHHLLANPQTPLTVDIIIFMMICSLGFTFFLKNKQC